MKDITTIKTADLIAEWGKYPDTLSINRPTWAKNRRAAIAAELDMRCVNANMESDGKGNLKTPCKIELPLVEFCSLCEWLLLKEGGNNG